MAGYPFTNKPEDVTKLLQALPSVRTPSGKVEAAFFKKLGFAASSAKSLLSVLGSLGFVNQECRATNLWRSFIKDHNPGLVLAGAIKNTYADLFAFTLCPYLEGDEEIFEMLKKGSKSTTKEVTLMVRTFRALCELADFQDLLNCSPPVTPAGGAQENLASLKVNPNLQLNIQIHIDPNTPDEKIEVIFQNMRKYLLGKTEN